MGRVPPKIVKNYIERYAETLKPHIKIDEVILFGSYARGDWHRDSDIDLIIISPNFKKMKFMERLVWLSKMRSDRFIDRAMDILGYTKEEFKKLRKESAVLSDAWKEGVAIK